MTFTKSWDATKPLGSEVVSEGDNVIVKMKEAARERLAKEHSFELVDVDDDTKCGKHKIGFITAASGYLGSKCVQEANYGDASIPQAALQPGVNQGPFRGALGAETGLAVVFAPGTSYDDGAHNFTLSSIYDTDSFLQTSSSRTRIVMPSSGLTYVRFRVGVGFTPAAGVKGVLQIGVAGSVPAAIQPRYVSQYFDQVYRTSIQMEINTPPMTIGLGSTCYVVPMISYSSTSSGNITLTLVEFSVEVIR